MPDSFSASQSVALFRTPSVLEGMLRGFELLRGLAEDELERLSAAGKLVVGRRGEVLQGEGPSTQGMFLILRGRVEVALVQASGSLRVFGLLGPGDHFGELALLTAGKLASLAVATTDVTLFVLEKAAFDALLHGVPTFAENLSRALGLRLASASSGRVGRPLPGIVGLACTSARAVRLVEVLTRALEQRGAPFVVAAPRDLCAQLGSLAPLVELDPASGSLEQRGEVVGRIAELRAGHDLVLLLLEPGLEDRPEDPRLVRCEELWAVVDPEDGARALHGLSALLARRRTLQGRTRLLWALHERERPARLPRPAGLLAPELRVFLPESGPPATRRQELSLRRLVADLEGQRVGIALGGGGARGLAHCGVLRVLEEEGIAVDRIAGTSMGALVGMTYAAGTPPDQIVEEIAREARTPLYLRWVPQSDFVNFWLKSRTRSFERSIRASYADIRFEELDLPLETVTSDLVQGEPVVRDRGDCVDAVIESINLPVFGRPILRDGRALVDGGILNNLPTDLLLAQQIETVVGVDVLSSDGGAASGAQRLGLFESLLRIADLQHERLTAHGAGRADLLLRVNAGRFALTDFSPVRAREIAAAGETAARQSIDRIRALVPARWRGRE